jgi:hypothetical protein
MSYDVIGKWCLYSDHRRGLSVCSGGPRGVPCLFDVNRVDHQSHLLSVNNTPYFATRILSIYFIHSLIQIALIISRASWEKNGMIWYSSGRGD